MPFPYRYVCDLLQQLDDELRKTKRSQASAKVIVESWFVRHRALLNAPDNDACAILSTLLPERRTDRVYFIQVGRLQSIIGQALCLGSSRVQELRRYTTPGLGLDLADCVESILDRTPNPTCPVEPTVEEVDEALSRVAAACRFSSPTIRALPKSFNQNDDLARVYLRLNGRDAKWFTRLILKNYQPVVLNENLLFRSYHVLLPQMMRIRDDLSFSTAFLRHVSRSRDDFDAIATVLKPCLGTKVGRQQWFKGRSIKNCLDMVGGRQMSCERKIDGEYCQIHIDLRKPRDRIQIFSKSGKDSTADRLGLHPAIRESLRLDKDNCPLKVGCILEGELVVYSTKEDKILPFHKIRKHVSRSGHFLGTTVDSQAHEHEHLMIIYYDVLLIDSQSMLGSKHSQRFKRLSDLITCRKGHAELVSRQIIPCSQTSAASLLRETFARCITSRGEGLVLKPDEPYFDFSKSQRPYSCCNIKLKKEYIQGFGDVGDFAVVGASYDPATAKEYQISNLKWTHFFIGCLENKEQARAQRETPRFRITNVVQLSGEVLSTFWKLGRPLSVSFEENESITLDCGHGNLVRSPTDVFPEPFVFDMRCFAFDKEPNTAFWTMRFPQVSKVHYDRTYLDAITFMELQDIAEDAQQIHEVEESQELRRWISALEKADPRGRKVDASSQRSTSLGPSPSPQPCQQKGRNRIEALSPVKETCEDGDLLESPASVHCPPRNPLTPPRSSAPEGPDLQKGVSATASAHTSGTKRSANIVPSASASTRKRPKCSKASKLPSPIADASSEASSLRSTRKRQPLGVIDANSSSQPESASHPGASTRPSSPQLEDPQLPEPRDPVRSSPVAYWTASEMTSSSPSRGPPTLPPAPTNDQTGPVLHQTPPAAPTGTPCTYAATRCALANCSVLLSPCIAGFAWLTEDLLGGHGVVNQLRDPRLWLLPTPTQPQPQPRPHAADTIITTMPPDARAASLDDDASSPRREHSSNSNSSVSRPARKICLVESRRREATAAFLREIEAARLTRGGSGSRSGQREWVAVYDWRLVDSLTEREKIEKNRGGGGGRGGQKGAPAAFDPWRQWYVGIA
ncbi:hypothetical protein GGR56DRAFT_657971 [Xylariaceae sp. FL0804]|nr:hypothetical protein GGR56DRAFT_657971 [Xylariaceae sp. FL0804]